MQSLEKSLSPHTKPSPQAAKKEPTPLLTQGLSERQAALVAAAEAEAAKAVDCPLHRTKIFQKMGSGPLFSSTSSPGTNHQQLLRGPVLLPPWATSNPLDSHLLSSSSSSSSTSNSPIATEVERYWAMRKKEEADLAADENKAEWQELQRQQTGAAAAAVQGGEDDQVAAGLHTCWFFDQAAELCAPPARPSTTEAEAAEMLPSAPALAVDEAAIHAPWWAARL